MSEAEPSGEHEEAEYFTLSEDAIALLPEEWRRDIQAIADDGRAVFKLVDRELTRLTRLSQSMVSLTNLKHIDQRLKDYRFEATMEAIHELEMLTTASVVTYVRLQQGGAGAGFDRNELPESLRATHDQIVDMRNKRFAHSDDHHSIGDEMEISLIDDKFEITLGIRMGYHIGGASEWHDLVDAVDELIANHLDRLMARLRERTGREWSIKTGPAPEEDQA